MLSDDFNFIGEFNPQKILKESIVTANESIYQSQCLLSINDNYELINVCTRGNISCIIGHAKSRKTFFITLICSAIINGNLWDKFIGVKGIKVVIFDTEQGRFHVQKVIRRIIELSGMPEKNITIYSLRPYSHIQRVAIIEEFFNKNNPDFVVIDGIRDLISDINNADQSTDIVNKLMKWSDEKNCHILTVLHKNKGDNNARGHLGTEIINKSESVLSVSKDKGSNYSTVEAEYTRGNDFESFQFTVKNNLPILADKEHEISYVNKF